MRLVQGQVHLVGRLYPLPANDRAKKRLIGASREWNAKQPCVLARSIARAFYGVLRVGVELEDPPRASRSLDEHRDALSGEARRQRLASGKVHHARAILKDMPAFAIEAQGEIECN